MTNHEKLTVKITYEKDKGGLLRIHDNAMGMSFEELDHALEVSRPPENTGGRSKYGMGMKTAACWLGDKWSVYTKKLGESVAHRVTVDVAKIAAGDGKLAYERFENRPLRILQSLRSSRTIMCGRSEHLGRSRISCGQCIGRTSAKAFCILSSGMRC